MTMDTNKEMNMNNQAGTFNDAAYVQHLHDEAVAKFEKMRKAIPVSIINVVAFITTYHLIYAGHEKIGTVIGVVWAASVVLTFILAGPITVLKGYKSAISIAWNLVPVFPFNLALGFAVLSLGFGGTLFFPGAHVLAENHQCKKTIKETEKYLSYCNI